MSSNILKYCAILRNIVLFQPIKARRIIVCPTHLSFLPSHHRHDTLASTEMEEAMKEATPAVLKATWLPSRTQY